MRISTNQVLYILYYTYVCTASCVHNIVCILQWRTKEDKHVAGQIFDSRVLQQPIYSLKQPQGWKVLATPRLVAHLETSHIMAIPPIAAPLPSALRLPAPLAVLSSGIFSTGQCRPLSAVSVNVAQAVHHPRRSPPRELQRGRTRGSA